MLELKFQTRIDYSQVINDSTIHMNEDSTYSDLNVIIPCANRDAYIRPTVKSIRESAASCGKKVTIYLVEHDIAMRGRRTCQSVGINYIYIPRHRGVTFNKCLCLNVGFLVAKPTNWSLFHDIDLIVPVNFFELLWKVIETTNKGWIQPFSKKSVCYLTNSATREILQTGEIPTSFRSIDYVQGNAGAPGGSICINSSLFQDVGGYDPEVFYGYNPEDEFLWLKMEAFQEELTEKNHVVHCHFRGAEYMENVNLYHLYHPSSSSTQDRLQAMTVRRFIGTFCGLPHESQKDFIKKCRALL